MVKPIGVLECPAISMTKPAADEDHKLKLEEEWVVINS